MSSVCSLGADDEASSCLPGAVLVGDNVIDLRLTPNRNRPQEERTVVTVHAGMAPHDLQKEEEAHFIAPSLRSR